MLSRTAVPKIIVSYQLSFYKSLCLTGYKNWLSFKYQVLRNTCTRADCFSFTSSIPAWSHLLGCISPWPHLLNRGSSRDECLLIMWLIKVLNLAQITRPSPLKVVEALQKRWFSHGLIQSAKTSHPFSLDSLLSTFLISKYADNNS